MLTVMMMLWSMALLGFLAVTSFEAAAWNVDVDHTRHFQPQPNPPNEQSEIARRFFETLIIHVRNHEEKLFNELVPRQFTFKGCAGENDMSREEFFQKLSSMSLLQAECRSLVWIGNLLSMEVTVAFKGNGAEIVGQFNIQQNGEFWFMRRGKKLECARRRGFIGREVGKKNISQIFSSVMTNLQRDVEDHNIDSISALFSDDFLFEGCTRQVNKVGTVIALGLLQAQFAYEVLNVKAFNEEIIEGFIRFYGLSKPYDMEVSYNSKYETIIYVKMHC